MTSACELNDSNNKPHSYKRSATQSATTIIKSPNDERLYKSIVLDNQLELVLVSDPSIEKSAAAVSVAVGSLQEPKGLGGLAHYLEHMLFMGTKRFPEVGGYSEFISQNGGSQNAYTELDHTNYMVAVNNDAFDEALARFSGFFYEALLDPQYADKERNAVHSEWTMKSPNDWVILDQLNGSTLNPNHPISQFNWGNLDTLTDKPNRSLHAELMKLYQTYYSANLMKAAIISPLPMAEIETLATKHFINIPNKQTPKPTISALPAPAYLLNKIVHYVPQTDMKQIQVKFVIENNSAQFKVKPNGYITYMLANEMPGTLASVLRGADLSEAVYADYDADRLGNAGELTLYIDLTDSGVEQRDKVMSAVVGYLALLKDNGVDKKYFHEIKQSFNNSFRFQEKTDDYSYAMQIAASMQSVPIEYVLSEKYTYEQFDPEAINNVLKQLNIDNARVFYIDQNQKTQHEMEYFDGKYSISDISPELKEQWKSNASLFALSLPRPNGLMPRDFTIVERVHTDKPKSLIQNKGYNVHLGHSSLFNQPKGLVKIQLNTGLTKSTARNHVLANILNRVIQQRLTELQSEASIAGMGLDVKVKNGISLSLSGFNDRQGELLARALEHVIHFSLSEGELENYIGAVKSEIQSREKQILINQLFLRYRQVLNLDNYSDQALLSELDNISVADIKRFKNNLLQQANIQVFAFGNYSNANVIKMADFLVSQLPKDRKPNIFYESPELTVKAKEIISWQQDVVMSDIALANTYLRPFKMQDLAIARVLEQIISPALFEQIRTEEQLAYSVGYFSQQINEQLLLGFYIQSPAKGLDEVNQRIALFRKKFSHTLNQLTDKEFNSYKQSLLITLNQMAKNLVEEADDFVVDWQRQNWMYDGKRSLIQAIEKVSLTDVKHFYQELERVKNFGRFIIQLRGSRFKEEAFVQPQDVTNIKDIDFFHDKYKK